MSLVWISDMLISSSSQFIPKLTLFCTQIFEITYAYFGQQDTQNLVVNFMLISTHCQRNLQTLQQQNFYILCVVPVSWLTRKEQNILHSQCTTSPCGLKNKVYHTSKALCCIQAVIFVCMNQLEMSTDWPKCGYKLAGCELTRVQNNWFWLPLWSS